MAAPVVYDSECWECEMDRSSMQEGVMTYLQYLLGINNERIIKQMDINQGGMLIAVEWTMIY